MSNTILGVPVVTLIARALSRAWYNTEALSPQ